MSEHNVSVTVNAPVHQVYELFSHFNDFPKFMSAIEEVTYYDDQRSHWVADFIGRHEWDAVNTEWITDKQIGWKSTDGFENSGKVIFEPLSGVQTKVQVTMSYNPPAGLLGDAGDKLGIGSKFGDTLQNDLDHFAKMVAQAPAGALDPTSSNYLFHPKSAVSQGKTTPAQNATMDTDEMLDPDEIEAMSSLR